MNEEDFAEAMTEILEHAFQTAEPNREYARVFEVMLAGIAVELRCIRLLLEGPEAERKRMPWED